MVTREAGRATVAFGEAGRATVASLREAHLYEIDGSFSTMEVEFPIPSVIILTKNAENNPQSVYVINDSQITPELNYTNVSFVILDESNVIPPEPPPAPRVLKKIKKFWSMLLR